MTKKLEAVEPAYAAKQVRDIDARIAAIDAEKKDLQARRRLFTPHLPKQE